MIVCPCCCPCPDALPVEGEPSNRVEKPTRNDEAVRSDAPPITEYGGLRYRVRSSSSVMLAIPGKKGTSRDTVFGVLLLDLLRRPGSIGAWPVPFALPGQTILFSILPAPALPCVQELGGIGSHEPEAGLVRFSGEGVRLPRSARPRVGEEVFGTDPVGPRAGAKAIGGENSAPNCREEAAVAERQQSCRVLYGKKTERRADRAGVARMVGAPGGALRLQKQPANRTGVRGGFNTMRPR